MKCGKKIKMANMTTIGAPDYSCEDPKWLIIKVVAHNGCNDRPNAVVGQICLVAHHLESLLGTIEVNIVCAFACSVGYFVGYIISSTPTLKTLHKIQSHCS
jgi:hypothetical protein